MSEVIYKIYLKFNFILFFYKKRDKDKEERDVKDMPKKRKPDQMASTSTAKKPKIKIEPDTVGLSQNSTDSLQNDIFNLESFKLDLVLPSKESAMHVLDCAFNSISAEIQKCNDSMKIDRLKANQASLLLQKGEFLLNEMMSIFF